MFERGEQQHDVRQRRAGTHQADPPDPARERTKTGADLDRKLVEQTRACTAASSTPSGTRTAFSVHSRSSGRRQQRNAEPLETGGERKMVPAMARPACLQPLFFRDHERRMQRVDERRRQRVMILAPDPVVLEQSDVQVEASRRDARIHDARARTSPARAPTERQAPSACSCNRRLRPTPPVCTGTPPTVVTASTIVVAPCCRAIFTMSFTGFTTPVDVSPCTTATMSARCDFSARAT